MRTIRLLLEYDGTDFSGWQRQAEGIRTIQSELETALHTMTGEALRARAASRTDAGVHARGQVVAFDTARDAIPVHGFAKGLCGLLPRGIAVRRADVAEDGLVPRRRARGKRYRYTFWNDPLPPAIDARFSWHVRPALDLDAMREAAKVLLGSHDFEAFRAADCPAPHAVRTLYEIALSRGAYARVHLDVVGNAFAKNMVRIIAGTLRDVGVGRLAPYDVAEILLSRDRTRAGQTAPPGGLCLEEVIEDDRLPPRPDGGGDG